MMDITMTWQLVVEVEDLLAVRVVSALRGHQVNLVPMEILEMMVQLEIQERLDRMLLEMSLPLPQISVLIVQLAHLDHQVVQGQKDLMESQAHLEILEAMLCRGHQGHQDRKDHRELMDYQVTPEPQVHQVRLSKYPERLDQLDPQDHQDQSDLQASQEHQETLNQDHKGPQEIQELMVLQETQAHPESQDHQDNQVPEEDAIIAHHQEQRPDINLFSVFFFLFHVFHSPHNR